MDRVSLSGGFLQLNCSGFVIGYIDFSIFSMTMTSIGGKSAKAPSRVRRE